MRSRKFVYTLAAILLAVSFALWFYAQQSGPDDGQNGIHGRSKAAGKLILREWSVYITLPADLVSDITYRMNDRVYKDFGGPITAEFFSARFDRGALQCATNDTPQRALISVERIEGVDPQSISPAPFKILNGQMYRFVKTSCEDTINSQGTAQDKRLLERLKKIIVDTLKE